MVFGRITAVGVTLKKKYDRRKQKEPQKHYLERYVEQEERRIKRQKIIRYKKYPFAVWFFGTMMTGSGITALVFILQNRHLLFEEFDHLSLIWKYLICSVITSIGLLAFAFSEIYTIVINKHLNWFMQQKKSIFGKSVYHAHILSDFKSLSIVRRGHISRDTDTTIFTIVFEFYDGAKIDTIYDRSIQDIKKKYAEILLYLGKGEGINFSDVKYHDEATVNYKFVYKSPFSSQEEVKQRPTINKEDYKRYEEMIDRYKPQRLEESDNDDEDSDSDDDDKNNNNNTFKSNIKNNESLNTDSDSVQFRKPIKLS